MMMKFGFLLLAFAATVCATFVQEKLLYDTAALQPFGISNETVYLHYYKHHAGYVLKLNQLAAADPSLNQPLLDLVTALPAGIAYNQAGQIANHDLYWTSMTPASTHGVLPTSGPLFDALTRDFGSPSAFSSRLVDAATGHFGSGWVFLVVTRDRKLALVDTANGDNPRNVRTPEAQHGIPILALDVWEHAYYVDYRNVRASYLDAFVRLIDWSFVETQYTAALTAAPLLPPSVATSQHPASTRLDGLRIGLIVVACVCGVGLLIAIGRVWQKTLAGRRGAIQLDADSEFKPNGVGATTCTSTGQGLDVDPLSVRERPTRSRSVNGQRVK